MITLKGINAMETPEEEERHARLEARVTALEERFTQLDSVMYS